MYGFRFTVYGFDFARSAKPPTVYVKLQASQPHRKYLWKLHWNKKRCPNFINMPTINYHAQTFLVTFAFLVFPVVQLATLLRSPQNFPFPCFLPILIIVSGNIFLSSLTPQTLVHHTINACPCSKCIIVSYIQIINNLLFCFRLSEPFSA